MDPVRKALWFIEGRFGGGVSLDDLAEVAGVSRFHFAHVFASATGQSAMRYLRGRRLTEAARVLADGGSDILTVAIDFGYGSHEAFTRAFREQFDATPESVRGQRHLDNLVLVEAIKMDEVPTVPLAPPRIELRGPLLIAGFGGNYSHATSGNIPALWQKLVPHLGHVPGQARKSGVTYGVCHNMDSDGNLDYLAGVEVTEFSGLPADFSRLRLAAQRYALFSHAGHVSTIRSVGMAIWTKWLPESGHQALDAPFLEYYGEAFDGKTGTGGFEIWIPLKD